MAWATWRACHGSTCEPFDEPPDPGEPVLEVEGVGDQPHPRGGGDAQRRGHRLGRERGDRRGALAAEGLVDTEDAGQGRAAPGGDAGVGGRGVPDAPLGGEPELAALGGSGVELALFEHREELVVVEVLDDDRSACCIGFEHVSIQAGTTDTDPPKRGGFGGAGETRR